MLNNNNNVNDNDKINCCACGDGGHVSRDCPNNAEFGNWWTHKNKDKVSVSTFAQIVEQFESLNAGNDSPVTQAQQEGQASTNIRTQNSSQGNQNNNQGGGFFFQQQNNHFNCGRTRRCDKPSFSFANIQDTRVLDTHNVEHKLKEDLAFGHTRRKDLPHVKLLDN